MQPSGVHAVKRSYCIHLRSFEWAHDDDLIGTDGFTLSPVRPSFQKTINPTTSHYIGYNRNRGHQKVENIPCKTQPRQSSYYSFWFRRDFYGPPDGSRAKARGNWALLRLCPITGALHQSIRTLQS
ncbi:hypothetical protein V6Z92_005971 [Aspergillus fumigatus]